MSVETAFEPLYARPADGVWAAPGRVNLIGEHTDYNEGFVLPIALPHRVRVAAARGPDDVLRVASQQAADPVEIALDELKPGTVSGWAGYPAGVVWALRDAGHGVGGLDLLVDGEVPPGAGLSSSAALECATTLAVADLYGVDVERPMMARIAQRAENFFVGMPCGIMDQSAAMLSAEGHALFLDTRSLAAEHVPLDLSAHGLVLLVVDTRAPHRLVDGEYAARRSTCEQAASVLDVKALRDIEASQLDEVLGRLPDDVSRRRVRHVVTENARVLQTVAVLRAGRVRDIGPLLTASHASLRDDYEVSVPELDTAVNAALEAGAYGARMTGGGFGGCVIALLAADAADSCAAAVREAFAARSFDEPITFPAVPSAGARRVR